MEYSEKINITQEILQYIDKNIKEKLSVEILAKRAGFSPYFFCRGFKWVTGISIMEYVRNRRLAYAASELGSGRKLLDIAVDYGFETHSGFSKAFRRFFKCPPEVYRTFASFKVPELQDLTKSNQTEQDKIIEPKIMAKRAAFKIAGFPLKVVFGVGVLLDEVSILKEECKTDGRMDKLHSQPFVKHPAEYGACFFKDYEDDNDVYVFGLEVKPKQKIPSEYSVFSIPESVYAVFSATPPINNTWWYILTEWLPNSGYEFDTNGVPFEFFDERSIGIGDNVCDIYIPVINIQL